MRLTVPAPGARQSVNSTGSQTTNTRTLGSCKSRSTDSTAEAPRRQVPQVGENSATTRVRSAAALNDCLKLSKCRAVTAGWPAGALAGT